LSISTFKAAVRLHLGHHRIEQGAQMRRILHRSGPQQRDDQGRREMLQAPVSAARAVGAGPASPTGRALLLDQADARLVGGDFGLGLLDARGKGGGFARGAVGGGIGALRIGLQLFGADAAASACLRASWRAARFGGSLPASGATPWAITPPASKPPPAAPISQPRASPRPVIGMAGQNAGRAPIARPAWRGPSYAARSSRQSPAADRPRARLVAMAIGRADQEAAFAHAIVAPAAQQRRNPRGDLLAALVQQHIAHRGLMRGIVPPRSGSSVCFTGQAMRFR
jgi:hypothetical protein